VSKEGNALRWWRIVSVSVVLLLSLSNFSILVGASREVSRQSLPLFHPAAQVSAADWLGVHATSDQVVLAACDTGNYLPTRMPARVFVGHGPETVNSDMKCAMVHRFFGDGDDVFRRRLLGDYGVTYVFYGPSERALGGFSPADAPYLRLVYDNGPVQIYQVCAHLEPPASCGPAGD
jgi:uncharacterized membrane protein